MLLAGDATPLTLLMRAAERNRGQAKKSAFDQQAQAWLTQATGEGLSGLHHCLKAADDQTFPECYNVPVQQRLTLREKAKSAGAANGVWCQSPFGVVVEISAWQAWQALRPWSHKATGPGSRITLRMGSSSLLLSKCPLQKTSLLDAWKCSGSWRSVRRAEIIAREEERRAGQVVRGPWRMRWPEIQGMCGIEILVVTSAGTRCGKQALKTRHSPCARAA